MKRLRKLIIIVICICLGVGYYFFIYDSCIAKVKSNLNKIKTLKASTTSWVYYFQPIKVNDESEQLQLEKKSRMISSKITQGLGIKMKIDTIIQLTKLEKQFFSVIFEPKHQFCETTYLSNGKVKKKLAYVLDREKLASKYSPFDTNYYISGTGLFMGRDYKNTALTLMSLYSFRRVKEENFKGFNCFTYEGALKENKLKEYLEKTGRGQNPALFKYMKVRYKYCKCFYDKEEYILRGYNLGEDSNNIFNNVLFEDVQINPDVIDDTFKYIQSKGVVLNNVTEWVIQNKKRGILIINNTPFNVNNPGK